MEFTERGILAGDRFGLPMARASLLVEPGGAALRVFNPVAAETVRVALPAGAAAATGAAQVTGLVSHGAQRVALVVDGVAGSVATDLVACARLAPGVMLTGYLAAQSPTAAQAVAVMAFEAGGAAYLVAARPAGSGIEMFRIGADQSLQRVAGLADTPDIAGARISALAMAEAGGRTVIYAASGSEHGVTAYAVGAGGALSVLGSLGMAEGVPVQGLTALRTVSAEGKTWLVAGAAGSSSLTVFRIGADGMPDPVDHVIDERGSRFAGVTALDAISHDGRVFVVAAGADDGISLFTLLPDGTLLHLAALADTATLGLARVSDLRLSVVDGVMQIAVLSAAEAGLTHLSVDLRGLGAAGGETGTAGDDLLVAGAGGATLSGGAGADILVDGAGIDRLAGGAGADLFVPLADGTRDTITDFDPALDRLDLSRWAFYRNAGQVTVLPDRTGAVLRFFGEELDIRSLRGKPLSEAEIRAAIVAGPTRLSVGEAVPATGGGTGGGTGDPPGTDVPAGPPVLAGTAAADRLAGRGGAEVIRGLGGDDTLSGGGGADTLEGGTGRDWLDLSASAAAVRVDMARWGDGSADVARLRISGIEGFIGSGFGDVMQGGKWAALFRGGAGHDTLAAGDGAAEFYAEAGNDSLSGGAGADGLWGGDGDDSLTGAEGDDRLAGGAGADALAGGAGNDALWGGGGHDRLDADAGRDRLWGGDGNDRLAALAGAAVLAGDAGEDTLLGGIGADALAGGGGADSLAGLAGNDSLSGDDGVDLLEGGAGADALLAGEGADRLLGGDGADTISGGAGDDAGWGSAGADLLRGDEGADRLWGGADADRLEGGAGNDLLSAGSGADALDGGEGADTLDGETGADVLWGGGGNDVLAGGDGNDSLTGGAGDDRLSGGAAEDSLRGEAGADVLAGGAGRDGLWGGDGADWMAGGDGDDRLDGEAGDDALLGDAGNDLLAGWDGVDRLFGGTGDDTLLAGAGADALWGGAGNDVLAASTGDDRLDGGEGDDSLSGLFGQDRLSGGAGRDLIEGGRGNDSVTGGAGADVFIFAGYRAGEVDVVTDFADGTDRLLLAGLGGAGDAERFRTLTIRDVGTASAPCAEIWALEGAIRLEGVRAGQVTVTDFVFG